MTDSIHHVLEGLPETSLTTRVLGLLDFVVPGQWENIRSLERMIESVTGETDPAVVQAVGEKALALWFDESTGFQRAATIYRLVDSGSTMAGATAAANLVGQKVAFLSFLGDVTPKPDTVQAVDAAVKFAAELAAFCAMNGIPGDSVGDFVASLGNAAKEDAMRTGAWIALDLVLPLGPDFLGRVLGAIQSVTDGELAQSRVFTLVADYLPGDLGGKRQLIASALASSSSLIGQTVADKGLTQDGLLARLKDVVEVADDRLDMVSAALDLTTNYYEHTGLQTVARRLVTRAYGEI